MMEKDLRRSDAYSLGEEDETPYFLPSTFSPWHDSRSDLIGNRESNAVTRSNSQTQLPVPPSSLPSPEMIEEPRQTWSANDHVARPSLPRRTTYVKPTMAATSDSGDEELMLRPHADRGVTEVVISAGKPVDDSANESTTGKRGALRRTKFKEMLSRSISSTMLNKKSSPTSPTKYNAIRDDTTAPPLDRETENFPMSQVDGAHQATDHVHEDEVDDDSLERLAEKYKQPPVDCSSRHDVYIKHRSRTYITLLILSIYSTAMSGLWLVVSIHQPRYGRAISSSKGWKMTPSTATLVCTLLAKTIELTFVTVFVTLLGQILTRRAFVQKAKGVTLAEMVMRNWVIQPGSLLTYWGGVRYAAMTVLGILTLLATLCSMFYTTASDAMVSPKLKFGPWESQELDGLVKATYANPFYIQRACTTPIDKIMDPNNSAPSCLDVQYSGQSYHNLLTFMSEWEPIHEGKTSTIDYLGGRPNGKHNLFDNTTMVSSWIEKEFGNPETAFTEHNRIINNVTLAMPHPGVYSAATDPQNDILQPDDLAGVGEYSIRASVVSPVVNVMCVNMNREELDSLVYTSWPDPRTESTEIPGQRVGVDDWFNDVPPPNDDEWLNRTAVDDIFRWGPKYQRRPPVFQLYPIDNNMITNSSVALSDSLYILAKSLFVEDYTLCELRSWVTSNCATEFDVSGIAGAHMRAHCEDSLDLDSYAAGSGNNDTDSPPWPVSDWRNVAEQWRLSMDLNGGTQNNNASNARIMTNLILQEPRLDPLLPSMAEALAVLSSSTLISSSLGSTYRMNWIYKALENADDPGQLNPGIYEPFRVSIRMQQYTSSHTSDWHGIFYVVLSVVFILNLVCLIYIVFYRTGLVTDYTEPQNLFAVAVNSPPSHALAGSCGQGPNSAEMIVPWRVGYSAAANHYFFEQAGESASKKGGRRDTMRSEASGSDLLSVHGHGRYRNSYKRLSGSRTWL